MKLFLYFSLSGLVLLSGCQGGSEDTSNTAPQDNKSSMLCPSGNSFEIDGVELTTDIYDVDNDGCISENEYEIAEITAKQIITQRENGLVVSGVNGISSITKINSLKVIGNSEVSSDRVQLHTNIDSGDIHISFEVDSSASSDETIMLYFDDESASGKAGTVPPYAMLFPLAPMSGNVSYVFGCKYQTDISVRCRTLAVTETDNIGSNVMSLQIDKTFPLWLTMSNQNLPQLGYIVVTFCHGSGESLACLNNYAEVPVSFN